MDVCKLAMYSVGSTPKIQCRLFRWKRMPPKLRTIRTALERRTFHASTNYQSKSFTDEDWEGLDWDYHKETKANSWQRRMGGNRQSLFDQQTTPISQSWEAASWRWKLWQAESLTNDEKRRSTQITIWPLVIAHCVVTYHRLCHDCDNNCSSRIVESG